MSGEKPVSQKSRREQIVMALKDRDDTGAKKARVMPPVDTATGGPMPGVDLIDLSTLQEIEDLEYVERMKRGFR